MKKKSKLKLPVAKYGFRGYQSNGPPIFKAEAGAIVDPLGQWAHPGKVTTIPSNEITMKGVPYPVMGISDTGHKQLMEPGKNYTFAGNSVTEYPMQNGGAISNGILNDILTMKIKLPEAKSGIHINPANKGKFNALKKRTGKTTEELKHSSNPLTRKRATFAANAKKWHHQDGGQVDPTQGQGDPSQGQQGGGNQMQQIMQQVAQMLQQGAQPQQVLQALVKEGIPKDQAQQLVKQVMQSLQGQQGQPGPPQGDPSQQQADPQQQGPPQAKAGMKIKGKPDANQQIQQLAQGVAQQDPKSMEIVKSLPPAAQQQVMQMAQQMAQIQQGSQDQPAMQYGGQTYNAPFTPNTVGGYYGTMAGYYGNLGQQQGQEAKKDLDEADQLNQNPYVAAPGEADRLQKQGDREQSAANAFKFTAGAAGVDAGIHGIADVAGFVGSALSSNRARLNDQQEILYNDRNNRAVIQPIHGDEQNGTAPAFKRFGGKMKKYQMGGEAPTQGSDFQSQNPNVMTEKGETIADPTKGPVGPDGQPTGVVVHDQTGDNHSDPSGGNAYKLGAESVVHSKVLGVKVGDFLKYAEGFPDAAKIIATVHAKYPDLDKEVSFAKIASLFDTKKLLDEVKKIEKKAETNDKKVNNESTKPTQTTAKLNLKTLAAQKDDVQGQIQQNSDIAGADGPIHAMSETLKGMGAYGSKVQKDQQTQAPQAKFGRKLKLPKAQDGTKIGLKPTIPYDPTIDNNSLQENASGVIQQNLGSSTIGRFPIANNAGMFTTPDATVTPSGVRNVGQYVMNAAGAGPVRNEQADMGYGYGATASRYAGDHAGLVRDATSAGFVPKTSWNDPDIADQLQSWSFNTLRAKDPNAVSDLYNRYVQTNMGANQTGQPSKQYGELDDPYSQWYHDKKLGIRFDDVLDSLLSKSPAAKPPVGDPAAGITTNAGYIAPGAKKLIYQEGLHPGQYVGDLATLFAPRRPVPYIEDKGAADALAATTRQRFVNPYIGDTIRANLAKTANNSNDPVSRANAAQAASNAWDENQKRFAEADRTNAGIEQEYNKQQNELRSRAGTNKASALNTLAERTAKVVAAKENNDINALTDWGHKEALTVPMNRQAALYQQMFPNAGWDPVRGLTNYAGGNDVLHRGVATPGLGDISNLKDEELESLMKYHNARGHQAETEAVLNEMKIRQNAIGGKGTPLTVNKFGGKIPRATPKLMRKK